MVPHLVAVACDIQLFRQKLSQKSVKVYATMPKGSLGNTKKKIGLTGQLTGASREIIFPVQSCKRVIIIKIYCSNQSQQKKHHLVWLHISSSVRKFNGEL